MQWLHEARKVSGYLYVCWGYQFCLSFKNGFWNCSDCVVFFCFSFLLQIKSLKKEEIDKGRQLKSHNQVNLSRICTGDICGTKNHTIEGIIKQI